MTSRTAADLAIAEMRSTLENQSTRLTQLASEIRGLSLNSVLLSELVEIPASGITHRDTSTPYASVGVWAYSGQVTVDSGSAGGLAPTAGIGVIVVPSGGGVVWPLVGTTLSIYGTAGDQVLIALWSKPQCPLIMGAGAIIGGGA
jgi:hypothetical protein